MINDFTNCLQLIRKGRKRRSNCLFGVNVKKNPLAVEQETLSVFLNVWNNGCDFVRRLGYSFVLL